MLVALKFQAATYSPIDGRIWLFGGQDSLGDMSDKIYTFNPTTGAYTEESVSQNLDDDEDDHDDDDNDRSLWTTSIGRWSAVTNVETTGDSGLIHLPGGRLINTVGSKSAEVYLFDPIDEIIGLARLSDYGYWRYSVSVAEREYNTETTPLTNMHILVTGVTGKTFIDKDLTFSPSGATAKFLELSETDAGGTLLRIKALSGTPTTSDTVTADDDTFSASVAALPKDDFTGALNTDNWDNVTGGWSTDTGQLTAGLGAEVILLENDPDWPNQQVSLDVEKTISGDLEGELCWCFRAAYSGSAIQSGYKIIYRDDNKTWSIERVVATVATEIASLDVTGDTTRHILDTGTRPLSIVIEDTDPVLITVTFNSLSIFAIQDFDEDRIKVAGRFAIESGVNA